MLNSLRLFNIQTRRLAVHRVLRRKPRTTKFGRCLIRNSATDEGSSQEFSSQTRRPLEKDLPSYREDIPRGVCHAIYQSSATADHRLRYNEAHASLANHRSSTAMQRRRPAIVWSFIWSAADVERAGWNDTTYIRHLTNYSRWVCWGLEKIIMRSTMHWCKTAIDANTQHVCYWHDEWWI